jgi:hypothetical protein
MNILKHLLPKKEAILNKDNIIKDMPRRVSAAIYPKEVLKIHNEFNTAADKLVLEATGIIKEAEKIDISKITRLKNLGFKQSSQVLETKPLLDKAALSKEQVDLIKYYKREYPFNKFITEEQVKTICHKYNLVCGDVSIYKGFVPDKNLREIEAFKLKDKEKYTLLSDRGFLFENAEVRSSYYGHYFHIYKRNEKGINNYSFQSNDGIEFYSTDSYDIFGYQDKGFTRFNLINDKLQICAPVKDMDIKSLDLKEGYKLEKKHIPDPIVLQPVKGGYLILTAWGNEASDPLVVNEIMN